MGTAQKSGGPTIDSEQVPGDLTATLRARVLVAVEVAATGTTLVVHLSVGLVSVGRRFAPRAGEQLSDHHVHRTVFDGGIGFNCLGNSTEQNSGPDSGGETGTDNLFSPPWYREPMLPRVAAFTDTYLPTVNGVTYAVRAWRGEYHDRGGRMHVVYPDGDRRPERAEHPVESVPFPFYEGFRVGVPDVPAAVRAADIVHAHTPFTLGLSGLALARRENVPFVASYHTPTREYADYVDPAALLETGPAGLDAFDPTETLSELDPTGVVDDLTGAGPGVDLPFDPASAALGEAADQYERVFYERADAVVVPSETARRRLPRSVSSSSVAVVGNGVDLDRFRPVDTAGFRQRHDLPDGPLVGYTGRHGHEKDLDVLVEAAADLGATVVFGGDGPARDDLATRASEVDGDVRFLGFLDREELPAFYAALSVFVLPSPVETQGLVALEANACGTPAVGADAGALVDTVDAGETGYRFDPGDPDSLADAVRQTLAEREHLRERCLERRPETGVERAVDRLLALYRTVT